MEPKGGVVIGDLRVLVAPTHTSDPFDAVMRGGWKVTVSPADSPEVIAERRVGLHHTAERIREDFVRAVRSSGLDRTDAARIKRLLGA